MRPGLGPDADRARARLAHTPDSMASMPWCCLSIPRARETWRCQGWGVLVDSPWVLDTGQSRAGASLGYSEARELQGPSRRQAASQPPALELVGLSKPGDLLDGSGLWVLGL